MSIYDFVKRFSIQIIWIFIALIVGFFLLGLLKNKVGGPVGSFADAVERHAMPQ